MKVFVIVDLKVIYGLKMGILDNIEYKLQARRQAKQDKQQKKQQWADDHPEVTRLKQATEKGVSKLGDAIINGIFSSKPEKKKTKRKRKK